MTSSVGADADVPPRVSIVIPTYNRGELLACTVDSVCAQTNTEWELVIFDDGSTDSTAALGTRYAAADPRVRYISDANGGVAMARNRGLAATDPRSDFVILLDHDDVWEPDALACLIDALDSRPTCVAVHGLARCIDDLGNQPADDVLEAFMRGRQEWRDGRLVPLRPDEPTSFAALAVENWIVTPGTLLVRRDALIRAGPFDPRTAPADDWDLVLRLSRIGDIGLVEHVVLLWRRHEGVLSAASGNWRRAYFRVRDKLLVDPANTPAQARSARATYRRVNRGSWAEAWSELRQHRLSAAANRVARALNGEARYARGVVVGRLARLRGAPAHDSRFTRDGDPRDGEPLSSGR